MEEPLSHRPEHQAPTAEETQHLRSRLEIPHQLNAAEVMSFDSDLQIFQRFNGLRIFVIIRLQSRLAAMTEKLDNLKKVRNDTDEGDIWGDITLDNFTKEIEYTLRDYDAAIMAQARVDEFSSPPQPFLDSFIKFCATCIPRLTNDLGVAGARKGNPDALAAIALKEKSWTHRLIDQNKFLQRHLARTVEHKTGWTVTTYSESNIRRAELIFVNVTFSLMLLCPIIALSCVNNVAGKLAIVLGFLLLGAILTSGIVTRVNNGGLGVLAGYGAVLVFFLGVKIDISS